MKQNLMSMMNLKTVAFAVVAAALLLSSCKKDKNSTYTIPTTYDFENVSYSGQTTRLNMMGELASYAKSASEVNAPALDAQKMKDMYANENSAFSSTALNSADKQLKNKTQSTEQTLFEDVIDALATASNSTANTSPADGTAGIMQNSAGDKSYLVNANGMELAQILEKGLMGACFYYQATAVYMGSGKMDVDNETVEDGKGTAMEHHWDEAFGYFGVPTDFPSNTTGIRYWGKYCNGRDGLLGTNATLMNALIAGRAAISAKDLAERDVQITKARREWEKVVAATAVHYINTALDNFSTDAAVKHHALSEAWAFVYSLKWGGDATITAAEIDAILNTLGGTDPLAANIYSLTATDLESAKSALVNQFGSLEPVKDEL